MGSIQLLDAWLRREVELGDEESRKNVAEMLRTIREVRDFECDRPTRLTTIHPQQLLRER